MSSTYLLCKRLIAIGLTAGLQDKLDTFFAMNRLSMEEYTELTAALEAPAAGTTEEETA